MKRAFAMLIFCTLDPTLLGDDAGCRRCVADSISGRTWIAIIHQRLAMSVGASQNPRKTRVSSQSTLYWTMCEAIETTQYLHNPQLFASASLIPKPRSRRLDTTA